MEKNVVLWLDSWTDEHVHAHVQPNEEPIDDRALELAQECIEAAREDDYTKEELEDYVGDLDKYMHMKLWKSWNKTLERGTKD